MASDRILPALAQTLARYLPDYGVTPGHVYDLTDEDPTPEAITLPGGNPVIGFVDPYQLTYDTPDGEEGGRGGTWGYGGHTTDLSTVLVLVFIGSYPAAKAGVLARRARPWLRYAVKDCIRQHNTLGQVVWKARCASGEAGPLPWGVPPGSDPNWYVARFTVAITEDRQITPGSD